MPVAKETSRWEDVGDGSTTTFFFDNVVYEAGDLKVYLDGVLTASYTVAGLSAAEGGSVTFTSPPGAGVEVVIVRDVPATQPADYTEHGKFPSATHERVVDRLTVQVQQLKAALARKIGWADSEKGAPDPTLGSVAARASKFLGFDALGNLTVATLTTTALVTTAIGEALVGAANAAAARAVLVLEQISMLGSAVSHFRIFEVESATTTFNDYVSGGSPATQDYDISWMAGPWVAWNLRWNATHGILELIDETKGAFFFHFAIDHFPDVFSFTAVWVGRVQSASARAGAGNVHKPAYPDTLIWPSAGSVGGCEMLDMWGDNGAKATAVDVYEMDGNGAGHAYFRWIHRVIGTGWWSGFISNSDAARSTTDFPAHPSAYWGIKQTVSGGVTTALRFMLQVAPATGTPGAAPSFSDIVSVNLKDQTQPYDWLAARLRAEFIANFNATSVTAAGATVTFTRAAHGLTVGGNYCGTVTGASPAEYNGTFRLTVVDVDTITYEAASAPASSPATGTVRMDPVLILAEANIDTVENLAAATTGKGKINFTAAFADADAYVAQIATHQQGASGAVLGAGELVHEAGAITFNNLAPGGRSNMAGKLVHLMASGERA